MIFRILNKKLPLLFLFFFILLMGSAYSPSSRNVIINNREMIDILAGTPTPLPETLITKTEEAVVIGSPLIMEDLPQPTLDLDFVSYRYHSIDIPDEVNSESDFWIDIDLTNQMLFAYRDNQFINGFKISQGSAGIKQLPGTIRYFQSIQQ